MSKLGIEAKHVSKSFGDRRIIQDLSLEVPLQQSLVIMGQSGSGKSVLLKCLLGFVSPDAGDIWIGGRRLDEETIAEQENRFSHSGVVFQSSALFDSLRVWENVAFSMKGSRAERRQRAIEILASVELRPHVADLYPSELSGGMKRRVSIARAIALSPQYLFFDEPTEGLDPVFSTVISQLIREVITRLKATAITITHNVTSAEYIADRIALLHKGRIAWKGTPKEMKKDSQSLAFQFIQGNPSFMEA